jgi:hypothetical protein
MDTRAKLYWADGRVQTIEHFDVDPTATIVQYPTPLARELQGRS